MMSRHFLLLLLSSSTAAVVSALDEASCNSIFFNPFGPEYFNILNFTAYPEILKDDSSITLAQAGTFVGPKDFEEYVSFATFFSPYVAVGPINNGYDLRFLSYDNETNTCNYRSMLQAEYILDDDLAGSAAHFNVTYSIKYQMHFSADDPYLKKAYVYYPTQYLDFFFNQMGTLQAGSYICDELATSCNNTMDGEPRDTCLANFMNLPITHGNLSHFDGNSRGCRVVHAVLAESTPDLHCPHFAFTPMEDPNGSIKCQQSKGYDPSDLFSLEDMAAFESFQLALGVDPEVGYTLYPDSPPFDVDTTTTFVLEGGDAELVNVDSEEDDMDDEEEELEKECDTFQIVCTVVEFFGGDSAGQEEVERAEAP